MNNSFSLQQIQKRSNVDANLISRQYKPNLMADFMRIKYENPRMKQSEIAKQLGKSSSTLQRYRNDINMLSPYRNNANNTNKRTKKAKNTTFDNNLHNEPDVKRPQMTSKETVKNRKNKLKGGANIEIDGHYLDKILKNNNT